jgi:hypothetical protein
MYKAFLTAGLAAMAVAAASPASAAMTLADTSCNIDTTGCWFVNDGPGGANDTNPAEIEAVYNAAFPGAPIDLVFIKKVEFDGEGPKTGGWTSLTPVSFITVKASNSFMLYSVDELLSGSWTTAGILNNGGKQPGISHYTLWGTPSAPVPEPATWAMMIAGFGLVGGAMRYRGKATLSHA